MSREFNRFTAPFVVACLFAQSALAQTRPKDPAQAPAAVEVARIRSMEGTVEVQRAGGPWIRAAEEQALSIGDRVRTQRGGTAHLEFPWTAVAMGDASEISLQKSRVLTLQLETGRLDIDPEQSLLRVVTAEAAVSGSGRTLIRRQGTITFVGSYNGGAEVEAGGTIVRLGVNKGTVVNGASPPGEAVALPPPPRVVSPSADPRYVRAGEIVHLIWTGRESSYHLEVLPIDSDVPVVSLDLEAREFDLRLNWLGTFRWRVSGRTGSVETQPSGEGLICVVEK